MNKNLELDAIETTYQHFDNGTPIDKFAFTRHIELKIGDEVHDIDCRAELNDLIEQLNNLATKCWGEK